MDPIDSYAACPEIGARLAALLDGELPRDEQLEIEEHVRHCANCTADLARQREARTALRSLADSLQPSMELRERVNAGLRLQARRNAARRRLILFGGLAAVLALLAAFGVSRVAIPVPSASVLRQVVAAHRDETQGTTPVSFESADADQVATWARSRAGKYFEVPTLQSAGYRLLGARMEPAVGRHSVTLVYEGDSGRLTCTVLPISDPLGRLLSLRAATAPTQTMQIQGTRVASWRDRDTTYVLVADLDADALLRLARLAAQPD